MYVNNLTGTEKDAKQYVNNNLKSRINAEAKKRKIPFGYRAEREQQKGIKNTLELYRTELEKHFDPSQIKIVESQHWWEYNILISKSATQDPIIALNIDYDKNYDLVRGVKIYYPHFGAEGSNKYYVEYVEDICDVVADLYDSYDDDVNDGIIKYGKVHTMGGMTFATIEALIRNRFPKADFSFYHKQNGKMLYLLFGFRNGVKGQLKFSLAKFDNNFNKILKAIEGFLVLNEVEGIEISYGDPIKPWF